MFVCTGNICRSPLAHGLLEHLAREAGVGDCYQIESSGLTAYHAGDNVDPRMRRVAARNGVHLDHRAQHFDPLDLERYDLILVMDAGHLRSIRRMTAVPEQLEKVKLFREYDPEVRGDSRGRVERNIDVPDPWYGGSDGFRNVYAMVERTCRALFHELEAERAGVPCGESA